MLELGPGTGANVPFFASLGVEYIGIDGSQTAVDMLQARYPDHCFWCGDFTQDTDYLIPGYVNLVIDRASMPHNTIEAMGRCIRLVHRVLRTGGHFIAVDWFSTEDTLPERFEGLGTVTRLDLPDIERLFKGWTIVALEHVNRFQEGGWWYRRNIATWNIVAKK